MMTERDLILCTNVGSHMWQMNHAGSDTDLYQVYVAPTTEILKGTADTSNRFDQSTEGIDVAIHEVGHVVNLLLQGNINAIKGVLSPIRLLETQWSTRLRNLVEDNPSKASFQSINGIATSNFHKYLASNKDPSPERCMKVARDLEFGIKWLRYGKADWKVDKTRTWTPKDVENCLEEFPRVLKESTLPDRPPEEPFRKFLFDLRVNRLRTEMGAVL